MIVEFNFLTDIYRWDFKFIYLFVNFRVCKSTLRYAPSKCASSPIWLPDVLELSCQRTCHPCLKLWAPRQKSSYWIVQRCFEISLNMTCVLPIRLIRHSMVPESLFICCYDNAKNLHHMHSVSDRMCLSFFGGIMDSYALKENIKKKTSDNLDIQMDLSFIFMK